MKEEPKMNYCCDCGWAVKKGLFRKTWYCTCPEIMAKTKKGEISPVNGTKTIEKCTDVRGPFNYSHLETMPDGRKLCKYYKGKFEGWSYPTCPPRKSRLPCPPLPERVEKAMEEHDAAYLMNQKQRELEAENKKLAEENHKLKEAKEELLKQLKTVCANYGTDYYCRWYTKGWCKGMNSFTCTLFNTIKKYDREEGENV